MRYVWSFIFPCFGSQRIRIFKGNEGTVQLAQNLIRTSNTSNIVIGHHFLRGFVFEGERVILFVKSEMKNADCLAKTLSREKIISYFRRDFLINTG